MSTDTIMAALRRRYEGNAYAFFEQVRDAAGFNAGRTADAVAMSLWPSRGLHLHGFEVKSDRRDWIREYKNPAKAESINRYCDFWWLVVSDRALVKEGELPETWGLLALKQGGVDKATGGARPEELVVVRQAPKLQPTGIDRSFLACLLRRAYEARPAAKEVAAAEARGKKAGAEVRNWQLESANRDLDALKQTVREFEKASGVTLGRWDAGRVGRAVRLVLDGKHLRAAEEIERVESSLGRILASLRAEREQLGVAVGQDQLEVPA
jgi:hypothetical protein